MRRFLSLAVAAVALAACATERPADDTAATTPAAAAPAGALTAADVSGNWQGMTYAEGTDSVVSRWTVAPGVEDRGQITVEGTDQPIGYTTTFDADSMIAMSDPYPDAERNGMMVRFRSVGRLQGDRLIGTSELIAVDGDSVLSRSRWEATRVQP